MSTDRLKWQEIDFQRIIKKSFSIHIKNLASPNNRNVPVLQKSPPIVGQLFQLRNNNYNITQCSQFSLPHVRSDFCETESVSFLGPKIWNIVHNEFNKEKTNAFKKLNMET